MTKIIPHLVRLETSFLLIAWLLGCSSPPKKSVEFPVLPENENTKVEVKQFLPNAYVVFHHLGKRTLNSLLYLAPSGEAILVDSPVGERAALSLISWMEHRLGRRPAALILSSHRWDRSGGAQVFKDQGVPVYGSSLTASMIHLADNRPSEETVDLALAVPTKTFPLKSGLKLNFGGEEIRVEFLGAGLTKDNVVVSFPDAGILFAGGLLSAVPPAKRAPAWAKTLRKFERFSYQWLIPAEGRRLSPLNVEWTLERLKSYAPKSSSR